MPAKLLIPALILVSSMILGAVIDKLFTVKLTELAERSSSNYDDVIVSGLRGRILLWCTIAGIYLALLGTFGQTTWFSYVAKALVVITILSVTIAATNIAAGLVSAYSRKAGGDLPSLSLFTNLTKALVVIVGILVTLQYLGISITPMLTALGVGGIAVALALQDTLSNIFAGIHILISQQIKPGDYIQLDSGQEGFVNDISWRTTSMRTITNNMVLVPNAKLAGAIVTNFELPGHEMALRINVGVSYASDLEQVERIVMDTARQLMQDHPGGVTEHEPVVRFQQFSDSSIDFSVILRTTSFPDQHGLKHEFIKRLHRRFQDENIEIPFPIRSIYIKKDG